MSGQIVDPAGVPYAYALVQATLITSSTPTVLVNGQPQKIFGQMNTIADANGNFTLSLFCNTASGGCSVISPGGTQWQITVDTNGVLPPLGTGPQTCSITVTITGSSQVVTFSSCPALGRGILQVQMIVAAHCTNATAAANWSIGSGGTVTCRAGSNNLGAFISISDTIVSFATFQIPIPEDWNTAVNPWVRVQLASTDTTNGDTIIPSMRVACYKGDGSTTDDVVGNAAQGLSTVTLNGVANAFWSTSNVQLNATSMTGCVPGSLMQITVGRLADTATNAEFYSATVTFQRLPVAQAN